MDRSQSAALQRLGEAIRGRRHTLGLTQRDVVAAGGPALSTLRQIESAKSPGGLSHSTTFALDRALRWAPGSADAMLTGGSEPQPLDTEGWPSGAGDWAEYVRRRARKDDAADPTPEAGDRSDRKTPLADYSDAQLIAELARRLSERHTPPMASGD